MESLKRNQYISYLHTFLGLYRRGQPQPPPPQEIGLVNRGYQSGPQGHTRPQGQGYVVTSQEQVNWPRLQFLRPMKGLQLIERKSFLGLGMAKGISGIYRN